MIEESDQGKEPFVRTVASVSTVVCLYVITAATIFYDELNVSAYPFYHLLSQVFGGSLWALGLYAFLAKEYRLPAWSNTAAIGILAYVIINIAYSVAELTSPSFEASYAYPFIEKWALYSSAFFCTYYYVKNFIKMLQ
jgi:hypothetical protein